MIYKYIIKNIINKYKPQDRILLHFFTIIHNLCQDSALDPLGDSQQPPTQTPQLHLTLLKEVERPTMFHYHFPKPIKTTLLLISKSLKFKELLKVLDILIMSHTLIFSCKMAIVFYFLKV